LTVRGPHSCTAPSPRVEVRSAGAIMEKLTLTKKGIVDRMIAAASNSLFTGDNRDGQAPPITPENFVLEQARYAARALRARLKKLSLDELTIELVRYAKYLRLNEEELQQIRLRSDRLEDERKRREHSEQQPERGRRHKLQPEILEAACHLRCDRRSAQQAWNYIRTNPFQAENGATVTVARQGSRHIMRVATGNRGDPYSSALGSGATGRKRENSRDGTG